MRKWLLSGALVALVLVLISGPAESRRRPDEDEPDMIIGPDPDSSWSPFQGRPPKGGRTDDEDDDSMVRPTWAPSWRSRPTRPPGSGPKRIRVTFPPWLPDLSMPLFRSRGSPPMDEDDVDGMRPWGRRQFPGNKPNWPCPPSDF